MLIHKNRQFTVKNYARYPFQKKRGFEQGEATPITPDALMKEILTSKSIAN